MDTKYNNITPFSEVLSDILITLKLIHPSPTVLAGQNHFLIILKACFDHCMSKSTTGVCSFNSQSSHVVAPRSVNGGPAASLLSPHCISQTAK